MADRAVTMRGLAERNVTADLATWKINFSAQGTDSAAVQAEIDRDTRTISEFFRAAGFPADAVTDGGGSVNTILRQQPRRPTTSPSTAASSFRTTDVMRARRAYSRQFDLIRGGVAIQEGSGMQYTASPASTTSSRR